MNCLLLLVSVLILSIELGLLKQYFNSMIVRIRKNTVLILLLFTLFIMQLNSQDIIAGYSQENRKFDSLDVRIEELIDNRDVAGAAALMLEKGKLLFDYGMYINATVVLDDAISMIEKLKDKEKDSLLIDTYIDCINWKGLSLSYMSNFDKALECFIAIEKYNNNKNNRYSAKAYNGMGVVFAMNNNNTLAEEYYKKSLVIGKKVKGFNLFPAYSNLGAVFMAKNDLDSAQVYFLDAYKMVVLQKDRSREIASLQSLGMVSYRLGKYNLSLKYYNEASDIAIKEGNYSQLSYLKFNMIKSYLELGDYESGFRVANEALKLAKQNKAKMLEYRVLKELSKLYEKQGDYKKSLKLIKQSLSISDSLFNYDSESKLLRQKNDFDMYRIKSEKEFIDNHNALELANRRLNNVMIWFLVGLLILILYIITIRLIKQYRINKQLSDKIEYIQIDDESRRVELEKEIEIKRRELTSTSLLIVKFNELSYLLNSKLRILKANQSSKSKDMEVIREMEELIAQFAPEKSWEQFKHHFEQISPEFYDKLDIQYPDLTIGEKRICALISLNLNTKEIASLTGKSVGAIETSKTRIKRKMNIKSEVNIVDILSQIKY